jgi:hypothetical protein
LTTANGQLPAGRNSCHDVLKQIRERNIWTPVIIQRMERI